MSLSKEKNSLGNVYVEYFHERKLLKIYYWLPGDFAKETISSNQAYIYNANSSLGYETYVQVSLESNKPQLVISYNPTIQEALRSTKLVDYTNITTNKV
jgi:hypothetical protein